MYIPKRGCDNVSDDKLVYHPMRALTERDQTLIDVSAVINNDSVDQALGYFVTKCSGGAPCANDIHR